MKIRNGFVSNSSSTAFIICNTSEEPLTLVDFVKENPQLLTEFNEMYSCHYTLDELLSSATEHNQTFLPHSPEYCVFGDEQQTVIGQVFDYILRDGGESSHFKWHFEEYLR